MDVDDAARKRGEDGRWDDPSVVGQHAHGGLQRPNHRDRRGLPEAFWLEQGQSRGPSRSRDGRGRGLPASARGTVGRGHDGKEVELRSRSDRVEDGEGEPAGPEEDRSCGLHGRSPGVGAEGHPSAATGTSEVSSSSDAPTGMSSSIESR